MKPSPDRDRCLFRSRNRSYAPIAGMCAAFSGNKVYHCGKCYKTFFGNFSSEISYDKGKAEFIGKSEKVSEDHNIIRRVKNGDVHSFSVIVEKYHRPLLNFIYRLVGDRSMVEDIGQEVFLNAYKSVANFDENRGIPFSAWLYTIARNRCISELRKKKQKFVSIEDQNQLCCETSSAEESFIAKEQMEAIAQALTQLPEPFKTALLESLEGKTVEEIARKEHHAINTIKTRIFRAKEKLRQLLNFRGYLHE